MFELIENLAQNAVIKVIGVGGGGGNAVRHMVENNVTGVEFVCANTDAQALKALDNGTVLKIGGGVTKGLGAGANPDIGRQAAMEDRDRIAEVLRGADMVFITAGMGGGTGTGAAPVVAQVAREMGILTVAVVTKPFPFEGKKRMAVAQQGLAELAEHVDSLITIPNEKLLTTMDKSTSLLTAFKAANDVLLGAVQGIAELIINDGMINVDFADVRTVMAEMGVAMMGTGKASGENRARAAAEAAIRCPLLDNVDLQGARGILVNITAGFDLTMGEFEEVGNAIHEFASENATVVVGTVLDPEMSGELRVTVVATGLGHKSAAAEVKPTKVVDNTAGQRNTVGAAGSTPNYADLDRPAVLRNGNNGSYNNSNQYGASSSYGSQAASASAPVVDRNAAPAPADDLDYLDIPAFLRRQAD
ncbi:MAG: cell division protein FtsZ [Pseudomonadales bacterium]|jgi:cell division protein FtsZ|nr:cell division protein FtsZ [Cellvibrionales bacterium]MBP8029574.1 cell division protein FtsZ [Pseudomonadales bacterium]